MLRVLVVGLALFAVSCSSVSPWRKRVYAYGQEPQAVSPTDGAKILWVIEWANGKKSNRHLGVSMTDGSYWRYEYHGLEPANPEDRKDLDELMETWKRLGTKLEDFRRD